MFGEEIAIKAEIGVLHNTSSHADKHGLIKWLNAFEKKPRYIFVNHGSDEACSEFANYLKDQCGYNAAAPHSGTEYELITGKMLVRTENARTVKQQYYKGQRKLKDQRAIKVFNRLMASVNRLSVVAEKCEGMSNKDIARFADQVDQISDKWSM